MCSILLFNLIERFNMYELSNMPMLPGAAQGRAPKPVDAAKLNEVGVNGAAFSIHKGDTIEFPNEDPLVVEQKISNDANSATAYYVAVNRNGKPSWLGIGILTRRDADGKPLGKFQEDMLTYPSFKEIYEALRGKKIKGGELKNHDFAVFENGQRTDKRRTRQIPEIEYA